MRIALGGIAVECCTFSPLPTRMEDLAVARGAALLAQYPYLPPYEGVDLVPLVRARATPGGPVERPAYDAIKDEFLAALRDGGPWDGVFLDMHGALFVDGMCDAEGDWIAETRAAVGANCLIAASYDLHGNVSPRVMENLDILTAYRTAPHIDGEETRARAVAMLIDCLRRGVRPHCAWVSIPTLLPGEKAMTSIEPAKSLYGGLPEAIARHGLLDASLLVGYAWADEPRSASAAVAVGESADSAGAAARELAAAWWAARGRFGFGMPTGTIDECIAMAREAAWRGGPVFISDAGDNITGGGVGDLPTMVERMLAAGLKNALYAAIADAPAVSACAWAGVGGRVSVALGGKLDPLHGAPLPVTGTVLRLYEGERGNRQAVLEVEGLHVMLLERRTGMTTMARFTDLGLDVTRYDIVVIKLGYLFPELLPIAKAAYLALSPGAINPVLEELPYRRLERPIYPLDSEFAWQPEVRYGARNAG